jgi:hypothetical protein
MILGDIKSGKTGILTSLIRIVSRAIEGEIGYSC